MLPMGLEKRLLAVRNFFSVPCLDNDQDQRLADYREALEWYEERKLDPDREYETELELAIHKAESIETALDVLDGKIESLFRFASMFSIALLTAWSLFPWPAGALSFPLVPVIVSMMISLRARQTIEKSSPVPVSELLDWEGPDRCKPAIVAASLHTNNEADKVMINWKASLFDLASDFLLIALLAMTLTLAKIYFC